MWRPPKPFWIASDRINDLLMTLRQKHFRRQMNTLKNTLFNLGLAFFTGFTMLAFTIGTQESEAGTIINLPETIDWDIPELQKTNAVFRVVEQKPRFPGCEDLAGSEIEKHHCSEQKLLDFVYKNLRYPVLARKNGITGTVVVSFIVEKSGKLTKLEILRDIGGDCGREALRVVNLMNERGMAWNPGSQSGHPVRVYFTLPVKFRLD